MAKRSYLVSSDLHFHKKILNILSFFFLFRLFWVSRAPYRKQMFNELAQFPILRLLLLRFSFALSLSPFKDISSRCCLLLLVLIYHWTSFFWRLQAIWGSVRCMLCQWLLPLENEAFGKEMTIFLPSKLVALRDATPGPSLSVYN